MKMRCCVCQCVIDVDTPTHYKYYCHRCLKDQIKERKERNDRILNVLDKKEDSQ